MLAPETNKNWEREASTSTSTTALFSRGYGWATQFFLLYPMEMRSYKGSERPNGTLIWHPGVTRLKDTVTDTDTFGSQLFLAGNQLYEL